MYAFEVVSKIAVQGWRRYVESAKNVFDFSITMMAIVSSLIVYYPNEFSDSRLIRMILTARVLRLIRLLTTLRQFQLIGTIAAAILPSAQSVMTVLFMVMYLFAAIGMCGVSFAFLKTELGVLLAHLQVCIFTAE